MGNGNYEVPGVSSFIVDFFPPDLQISEGLEEQNQLILND